MGIQHLQRLLFQLSVLLIRPARVYLGVVGECILAGVMAGDSDSQIRE